MDNYNTNNIVRSTDRYIQMVKHINRLLLELFYDNKGYHMKIIYNSSNIVHIYIDILLLYRKYHIYIDKYTDDKDRLPDHNIENTKSKTLEHYVGSNQYLSSSFIKEHMKSIINKIYIMIHRYIDSNNIAIMYSQMMDYILSYDRYNNKYIYLDNLQYQMYTIYYIVYHHIDAQGFIYITDAPRYHIQPYDYHHMYRYICRYISMMYEHRRGLWGQYGTFTKDVSIDYHKKHTHKILDRIGLRISLLLLDEQVDDIYTLIGKCFFSKCAIHGLNLSYTDLKSDNMIFVINNDSINIIMDYMHTCIDLFINEIDIPHIIYNIFHSDDINSPSNSFLRNNMKGYEQYMKNVMYTIHKITGVRVLHKLYEMFWCIIKDNDIISKYLQLCGIGKNYDLRERDIEGCEIINLTNILHMYDIDTDDISKDSLMRYKYNTNIDLSYSSRISKEMRAKYIREKYIASKDSKDLIPEGLIVIKNIILYIKKQNEHSILDMIKLYMSMITVHIESFDDKKEIIEKVKKDICDELGVYQTDDKYIRYFLDKYDYNTQKEKVNDNKDTIDTVKKEKRLNKMDKMLKNKKNKGADILNMLEPDDKDTVITDDNIVSVKYMNCYLQYTNVIISII